LQPVADSTHFLGILDALPIETDEATVSKAGSTTLALARSHNLTQYDAVYLELAMRRNFRWRRSTKTSGRRP
jgi:predicted nucleic acid-binding protein